MAAHRARGRRQGDPCVSFCADRAGPWGGCRERRRGRCGPSRVPQSGRASTPQPSPHQTVLDRKDEALLAMDRRRRGEALAAFLGNTAGEGGWRVVIVDRADELNQNAANALLKALEEPPPRTLFLLISSAEGRLPITIRSRARTLRVAGLGDEDLERAVRAALDRDGQKADAKTLELALALSQGSVRRALELVCGEGIGLYEDILASFGRLPELDGARLHKLVERLSLI